MSREYLTQKSDGWYRGCGCGQKKGDLVTPPEGSVSLYITAASPLEGPVSGLTYLIVPNTTSIDIDPRDAAEFRKLGTGHDPRPGFKGVLTRDTPIATEEKPARPSRRNLIKPAN